MGVEYLASAPPENPEPPPPPDPPDPSDPPDPPDGFDPNAVRIIGTMPVDVNGGNATTSTLAYPFEMPAGQDYVLDSLTVRNIGNNIPQYSLWSHDGTNPVAQLTAFTKPTQIGDVNKLPPESTVTLMGGSRYAMVYQGLGGWRRNSNATLTPTGVATPLIDETDYQRSTNSGSTWTTVNGAPGAVSGLDSLAFGRVAFDLKGVAVTGP